MALSPRPLQIISIGDDGTDLFELKNENLNLIIEKIPYGMKVAVLSVVGAFRTGKSFLLNFFLRYLRSDPDDASLQWMVAEGDKLLEGNNNSNVDSSTSSKDSFAWRGGNERQTTGIWMWSEPFIRKSKNFHEDIAILIMDTQGMFDNQTTMSLTAQIFGLSTLVSSYQIYNVEKRIGEDNLQHLALFSEYGRMALEPSNEAVGDESEESETRTPATSELPSEYSKHFQRIQFLVRDYQNFDEEWEEDFETKPAEEKEKMISGALKNMNQYLKSVISDKNSSDLQVTREQIKRCFQQVDCFMLPHPGSSVTKKNFSGSIEQIEYFFRALVNIYVRKLFDNELEPKLMNNRFITGPELKIFFEVYANLFKDGNSAFPKAMTMLEATAEANNRNAQTLSIDLYKNSMEDALDIKKNPGAFSSGGKFVKEPLLQTINSNAVKEAMSLFDSVATIGPLDTIKRFRLDVENKIEEERTRFFEMNALRNPFRDMEMYVLPLIVAAVSWFISVLVDSACSTDTCERVELGFKRIYLFIIFGIIALTWNRLKGMFGHLSEILPMLVNRSQTN